jgi:hypothetical protein
VKAGSQVLCLALSAPRWGEREMPPYIDFK